MKASILASAGSRQRLGVLEHRPVEDREERDLVLDDVDADGIARLDGGAHGEDAAQACEAELAGLVGLLVAGQHVAERDVLGRASGRWRRSLAGRRCRGARSRGGIGLREAGTGEGRARARLRQQRAASRRRWARGAQQPAQAGRRPAAASTAMMSARMSASAAVEQPGHERRRRLGFRRRAARARGEGPATAPASVLA